MEDLEAGTDQLFSTEETGIDLGESVEESLAAAFEEVAPTEATEDAPEPAPDPIAEAARTLASAKRGKRKKEIPASELEPVPQPQAKPQEAQETKPEQPAKRFDPPARFPLEKKEFFNKLPVEMQEEIHNSFREWEGYFTKGSQELQRHLEDNREITRLMGHYMPQWNAKGMTASQAIAELCATQTRLVDPSTRMQETDRLLRRLGVEPEHIVQFRAGGGAPSQAPQQNPTSKGLTLEDVDRIIAEKLNQTSQVNTNAARIEELRQLQREVNADGSYKYRELHDDRYLRQLDSLVPWLMETQPGISFTEATKRAIFSLRNSANGGLVNGSPSHLQPARVSEEQEIQRARAASVSPRGRGNPSISTLAPPKADEKVEDSLRAVFYGTSGAY